MQKSITIVTLLMITVLLIIGGLYFRENPESLDINAPVMKESATTPAKYNSGFVESNMTGKVFLLSSYLDENHCSVTARCNCSGTDLFLIR